MVYFILATSLELLHLEHFIFRVEPFIAIKGHVIIVTALNQT